MKRCLRVNQIIPEKIPVAVSTWWRWVSEGKAPQSIKLGPRTTVWDADEIDEFIARKQGQKSVS